jgi:hypothetical protein
MFGILLKEDLIINILLKEDLIINILLKEDLIINIYYNNIWIYKGMPSVVQLKID